METRGLIIRRAAPASRPLDSETGRHTEAATSPASLWTRWAWIQNQPGLIDGRLHRSPTGADLLSSSSVFGIKLRVRPRLGDLVLMIISEPLRRLRQHNSLEQTVYIHTHPGTTRQRDIQSKPQHAGTLVLPQIFFRYAIFKCSNLKIAQCSNSASLCPHSKVRANNNNNNSGGGGWEP